MFPYSYVFNFTLIVVTNEDLELIAHQRLHLT